MWERHSGTLGQSQSLGQRDARLEAGWVRRMCVPKARYWTSMTPVIRVTPSKTAPLSS